MSFNEDLKNILREMKMSKKDVAALLGITKSNFQHLTVNNKLQPNQQKVVIEAIINRKMTTLPPFIFKCSCCGEDFESIKYKSGLRCLCDNCSTEYKPIKEVKRHKKPTLSISDILRIGKENGVHGYGRIVQMIERGELDVLSKK